MTDKPNTIAILYICTGAYVHFWEDFYRSFSEKFIPEAEKHYYVFTDAEALYAEKDDPHIHRIRQEHLGWPGATLFRYRMFLSIEEELQEYDYVLFLNANLICREVIHAEDYLPRGNGEDLVVVQHPGYYNTRPYMYTYERDKRSLAYVPYTSLKGQYYVCGGLNGGTAEAFLKMSRELDRRITDDYERGVIAIWHDESHLNKYITEYAGYRMLSPSYAVPEGMSLPFPTRICILVKTRYVEIEQNKTDEKDQAVQRAAMGKFRAFLLELWFKLHGK